MKRLYFLLIPAYLTACAAQQATSLQPAFAPDSHSFARPSDAVVEHLKLDLKVDFPRQQLQGTATLRINNRKGVEQLHLDSRGLEIHGVTLGENLAPTTFTFGEEQKYLGRPLIIAIHPDTKLVNIDYVTAPDAAALQWLSPEQTAGKKKPFLFTQSQAILARTWVPIQDTPSVRMTYEARIRVPEDLMAVMSAENPQRKSEDGTYEFRMPQPVPSYLLALAVGDLEFRPLGLRSGVYAEPSVAEKAAWELAETEKMISAAEGLYGPYRWGRYDLLILPPSFPFGGMENPRLTFATPSILAGDRSLVALVAHELAHSWSGNLVTNATWSDFWLNEGFTTYIEHRIMEAVYGREYSEMLVSLDLQDLKKTLADPATVAADTKLFLDLKGRDPDEGVTDIAYKKGYFFLRTIEGAVGRERFDQFLRRYFDRFAFQSMDTATFVDYLRKELIQGSAQLGSQIDVDGWIYSTGLPENAPRVTTDRLAAVDGQIEASVAGTPASRLKTAQWSTHEWLHFIRNLPAGISKEKLGEFDAAFHFSESGNSEILAAWFVRAIESKYTNAYPALERFVTHVGRRKLLKPIYVELAKTPEGLVFARQLYRKARPGYHSVSRGTIDTILKWEK